MSDIGKLQRPETATMDATELGGERELPSLEDPALARERAGGELKYRATGGARGVAPMQRLMDERRALGGQLAARVQRKADGASAAGSVAIPESGGSKLPDGVRAKMEPKLGADLSDVRVHTGGESAQAATGIGARAFTVGSDVHFNAGEFAPGSKEGDRLLAHELTHVVQGKKSGVQRKAAPQEGAAAEGGAAGAEHGGGEVSHPDEPAEKEADAVADGVADSLHGAKKGDAAGKDKDKDKKKGGHTDEHGLGAQAHDSDAGGLGGGGDQSSVPHEAAHVVQQGGGHAAGGEAPAAAAEKPAPISAKFVGVGRKIYRQNKAPQGSGGSGQQPPAANAGGAPPASSTKAVTPEETLSSLEFKDFQQRYVALCTGLQMPADTAAAQKLWLDVVRTLQTTNPIFAAKENRIDPDNIKSRADLSKAAVQKIIKEFDPIVAQLTPMMDKFAKGKKVWAFWSGKAASGIAKANAEASLEKSALGTLFDGINITGKWDTQMWAALSRAYATQAAKDVEHKTYRGFVGMGSSNEQSIFNKIEQPQFAKMLDQQVAATPKVTWYACVFDPTDPNMERPDDKCNVGGMTGVIATGPDRGSMVEKAEAVNSKRLKVYEKTKKVVPPDQVDAALAEAEKAGAHGDNAASSSSSSSSSSSAGASAANPKPQTASNSSSSSSSSKSGAPTDKTPKKS